MKIAWFTPFAAGTAIAESSAAIVEALIDLGHDPRIMRMDEQDRPPQPFARGSDDWRFWMHQHDAELIFYSFGDDFAEFAPAYELIGRRPGIAILHDASLSRYFAGHAAARGVAEEAVDAATSLERVAVRASGVVLLGAAGDANVAGGSAGPVLHLPGAAELAPAELAARLVEFAAEVAAVDPIGRMLGQIGDRLVDMGVGRDDPVIGRIAGAVRSLFPTSCRD